MTGHLEEGLMRALVFHQVWGHAPTMPEWLMGFEGEGRPDRDEIYKTSRALIERGAVIERQGRYLIPEVRTGDTARQKENELFAPRKFRAARRVGSWLARLSSVRFVALCNTTALGQARDAGDLDFFVIARHGVLMQTRGFGALPFKLLGRRPRLGGEGESRDAVCLSYFVSDAHLDLSSHMLEGDDPYFRHWFLSLLPLYDDGVSRELWDANAAILKCHPLARPWTVPPDFRISAPRFRIPMFDIFEKTAFRVQSWVFPSVIREMANCDTRVIVSDRALKFHVIDRREEFRRKYYSVMPPNAVGGMT